MFQHVPTAHSSMRPSCLKPELVDLPRGADGLKGTEGGGRSTDRDRRAGGGSAGGKARPGPHDSKSAEGRGTSALSTA